MSAPIERQPDFACGGRCEFHGQLWCDYYSRSCSEYAQSVCPHGKEFWYIEGHPDYNSPEVGFEPHHTPICPDCNAPLGVNK